jgi:hypothetical protein
VLIRSTIASCRPEPGRIRSQLEKKTASRLVAVQSDTFNTRLVPPPQPRRAAAEQTNQARQHARVEQRRARRRPRSLPGPPHPLWRRASFSRRSRAGLSLRAPPPPPLSHRPATPTTWRRPRLAASAQDCALRNLRGTIHSGPVQKRIATGGRQALGKTQAARCPQRRAVLFGNGPAPFPAALALAPARQPTWLRRCLAPTELARGRARGARPAAGRSHITAQLSLRAPPPPSLSLSTACGPSASRPPKSPDASARRRSEAISLLTGPCRRHRRTRARAARPMKRLESPVTHDVHIHVHISLVEPFN